LAITSQLADFTVRDGGNISLILAAIDLSVADDSFSVFAVPVHVIFRPCDRHPPITQPCNYETRSMLKVGGGRCPRLTSL